jgi:hypothetical protein
MEVGSSNPKRKTRATEYHQWGGDTQPPQPDAVGMVTSWPCDTVKKKEKEEDEIGKV